jgi:hypothetical protein
MWRHATHPDLEGLRRWLDHELRGLEPRVRNTYMSRLRDENRYTQALSELAAGYVLRQTDYVVEYEQHIDHLTPDLVVTNPSGSLWVPITSSGSCRERVFVDHTADPVVSADMEAVEIGDRCG